MVLPHFKERIRSRLEVGRKDSVQPVVKIYFRESVQAQGDAVCKLTKHHAYHLAV